MALKLAILALAISLACACPDKNWLHFCTCVSVEGKSYVTCKGLNNENDFIDALKPFVGKNDIYSLTLENLMMSYIPSGAFRGIKFETLEIVKSALLALSDQDLVFEGLEDTLLNLKIHGCIFTSSWDLSLLNNLKNLNSLTVSYNDFNTIDKIRGNQMENLEVVSITYHNITFMHEYALTSLHNVRTLILHHNQIPEIRRSMLPDPSPILSKIDLSYNNIEMLPSDIFILMPYLTFLNIAHNRILYLEEKVFSTVWNQLEQFDASGNELMCDCRVEWILKKAWRPEEFSVICQQPLKLKGKQITEVLAHELYC